MKQMMLAAAAVILATPVIAQDATGDADAGEALFSRQCIACHVIQDGDGEVLAGRNARTGPNLYGIVGAPPGSQHDFRYSDALVAYGESGAIWAEDNTVAFLQNPTGHLREALDDRSARSKMSYQVRREEEARDLYAYLATFSAEDTAGEGAAEADAAGETVQDAAAGEASEGGAAGELVVDIAAGEGIYQENCRNCHGPRAQGMASFPKLAGHDAEYLLGRLQQYHAGEKVGPGSALMIPVAQDLSEEDMANVAAYIASTFE
jgi:cytochrome c